MAINEKTKVLLAEPNPEAAKRFQKLLHLIEEVEILGTLNTAQAAVDAIRNLKPEVVLTEIELPDMSGITFTEIVRRDFPLTQVIFLSKDDYPDIVLRALRVGASDFLTHDVNLEDLSAAVRRAAARSFEDKRKFHPYELSGQTGGRGAGVQETEKAGDIISVYSPKGGSGVTTIAVNLAISLMDKDSTVALVDGSLQYGDVGILLNEIGKNSIVDIMPHIFELDEKLIEDIMILHRSSGLHVMVAPARPELAEKISGEHFNKILEFMRQMYDYVVVNTSTYITEACLSCLDVAEVVVLVCVQEISAIRSTRAFLELWDGFGMNRDRILLVLNRYDKRNVITAEKISDSLKHPITVTIPVDEATVLPASNLGIPFVLSNKNAPVSHTISDLANQVRKKLLDVEEINEDRMRLFARV